MPSITPPPCPCGPRRLYESCCGRFHGGQPAPDAEALMRSRYSAYVLRLEPYLLETWHRSTRPESLDLTSGVPVSWIGLEVKRHIAMNPDSATVEFVARYKVSGRAHRIHEVSRFVREKGRWYYVDGDVDEPGQRA